MTDLKLSYEEIQHLIKSDNINEEQIDTIFELSVLAYKALNKILKYNKNDE